MDLEKAYDSVLREGMWQNGKYYGIPTRIVDLLRNWCIGISSLLKMNGEKDN